MNTSYQLSNKIKWTAILFSAFLFGCSSSPRSVEAHSSLVVEKNKFDGAHLISSKYWSILNNPNSQILPHDTYQIRIGDQYISALGLECRPLYISANDMDNTTRITCSKTAKDDQNHAYKVWYLTNDILATTYEIDMSL